MCELRRACAPRDYKQDAADRIGGSVIYLIIWTHFVADFILQTHAQAQNKSSSNLWLGKHIASYSAGLFAALWLSNRAPATFIVYVLVNAAAHFATDWVTSRMTSKLWKAQRIRHFFWVIGADQAIHMTTLLATLPLLTSKGP